MKRAVVVPAILVLVVLSGAVPAAAAPTSLVDQPLTGDVAPGTWTTGFGPSSTSAGACLTAATPATTDFVPCGTVDPAGSGALRITEMAHTEANFALYNVAIPTANGLRVEFDMYQYSAEGVGADGSAFMLVDGAASPTSAGYLGLGLGYLGLGVDPGVAGAYSAVAFDWYGAFSDSYNGTGPGQQPNHMVVRGSEASNYAYIASDPADGLLAAPLDLTRTNALRHVVITVTSSGLLSVSVDYGLGPVTELTGVDLTAVNGALPATVKVGFTGGTGGLGMVQEFNNLVVDPLVAPAALAASGVEVGYAPIALLALLAGVILVITRRRRARSS